MSLLARRLTPHNPAGGNGGGSTTNTLVSGAWTWFHDPRAIYHSGTNDRTYVTWSGADKGIWVGSYDHTSDEFKSYKIHTSADVDDHHVAALGVRSDGRIIAAYTEHNGDMFVKISDSEDVWTWSPTFPTTIDGNNITYPNLVYLSSETRWYLFYRRGTSSSSDHYYMTSDDDGDTWSTPAILISTTAPYVKVVSDGVDQIHFAFTEAHPDNATTSLYHLYYDAGTWRDSDDADIGTPSFGTTDATQVYDGVAGDKAWVWDIALDTGTPVIAFTTLPSSTDHRYQYAKLGASWDVNQITTAGKHIFEDTSQPSYSAGLILDHDDPDIVYLAREVVTDRWELEKWTTSDGGSSWSSEAVTSGSDSAPSKNFRPFVPSGSPIDVLWCYGGYNGYTDFSSSVMVSPAMTVDTVDYSYTALSVTTGLLQWVDADTLNLDVGDGVSTWADQSGNGYDKTGTSPTWPLYTDYIIAPLPTVHFVSRSLGNQARMETSGGVPVSAGSDWTEFIVFAPTDWIGDNPGLWRSGASSTGNTFFIFQSSTGRPWVRWNGTNILQPGSGYAVPLDEPVVVTLQVESESSVVFRANGVEEHSDTHAVATPSFSIYNFFWQNDVDEYVEGYFGERIAYDRLLNSTEVGNVETYLMDKWRIS